jgi:regulator of sigma E protease
MLTVAAALVVLSVVILIHELGHFLAAKAVGIGVPRFSIGWGNPTPLRFQIGETEYVIAWLPIGGYVKMATNEDDAAGAIEGGDAAKFPPEKLFENKPVWARMVVISAGVVMNALLAWGLYTGIAIGGTQLVDPVTQLAAVDTAGLPPEAVGLTQVPFGTTILRINGDTVTSWNDVESAITDPGSARLRFDFASGVDPVIVHLPGTDIEARLALLGAMHNLREARVGAVDPGSPAANAGLQNGDLVVRVDDDTVRYWDELTALVRARPETPLALTVVRDGTPRQVHLTTAAFEERDPMTGESTRVGRLGVLPAQQVRQVHFSLGGAVVEGARQTVEGVRLVVITVRGLILRQVSPKELAGPIGIGQLSGRMARAGLIPFLTFLAFISINLAVVNLLPIPVMDGGHLVFLVLEGVRGKPVPVTWRLRLTQVGLVIIMAIVVLVVYNDVLRLLGLQ